MHRLFLDSTVLFSAAYSKTGAARELFHLAQKGRVELIINDTVVEETERNLFSKAPESILLFKAFLNSDLVAIIPDPTKEEILQAAAYTELKDAPIVSGAIAAQADYLVTFDRKHLIEPPEVSERSGLIIAVPGDILRDLRK